MVDALSRTITTYVHGQFAKVEEDATVTHAVSLLHSSKAETIIVTTKEGKPVGIVTDSDILDKVVSRGEDSDFVNLKSIMSSPIITISSTATVKQALDLMRRRIKRLPVTADKIGDISYDKIIGIVTQESLAYAVIGSVIERTFRPYYYWISIFELV
jgi:trk system potassium uptake protein